MTVSVPRIEADVQASRYVTPMSAQFWLRLVASHCEQLLAALAAAEAENARLRAGLGDVLWFVRSGGPRPTRHELLRIAHAALAWRPGEEQA